MSDYKRFFETRNLNPFLSQYITEDENPMYFVDFLNSIRKNDEERLNQLLDAPDAAFRVNEKTNETSLHLAARFGSEQLVQRLITLGADIEFKDLFRETACYMAIVRSVEMVQLFLDNGADIDIRSLSGVTMIQRALFSGSVDVVMLLLNRKYNLVRNLNEEASLNDSEKCRIVVNSLLDRNIDLDWIMYPLNPDEYRDPDLKKYPLLLHFVGKYGDEETFDQVLSESENVDLNKFGPDKECTLLQVLVDAEKIDFVRKILEHGVDVNLKTKPNNTALHFAIMRGNPEMVLLLIDYGADADHHNHPENAPLLLALRLENEEIMEMLLAADAGINSMAEEGYVLHYACGSPYLFKVRIPRYALNYVDPEVLENQSGSSLEIINFLIEKGADFNKRILYGLTPILVACRAGRLDIVEFLLDLGANLDDNDYGANGVLFHSIMGNNIGLVRFLLNNGFAYKEGWEHYLIDLSSLKRDDVSEMAEFIVDNVDDTESIEEVFCETEWNPILSAIYHRKPKTLEGLLELLSTYEIPFGIDDPMPLFNSCSSFDIDSIDCVRLIAAFLAIRGIDIYVHIPIRNGLQYDEENGYEIYDQEYEDSMNIFSTAVEILHYCDLELNAMDCKKILDEEDLTYFDFLTSQLLDVLPFINREKVIDVFESGEYKKLFPYFSIMLEKRLERLEKLRTYSDLIKIFLQERYGIQTPFPVSYLYRLFSFCKIGGVRNFGRALTS